LIPIQTAVEFRNIQFDEPILFLCEKEKTDMIVGLSEYPLKTK